jgi:Flp pilus assembly protein TadG
MKTSTLLSLVAALALVLPFGASAQFGSLKLPGAAVPSPSVDLTGQNESLVRDYVASGKEVLLANALMAEALGLKDQAAAARATSAALTDGATKGSLEEENKAVSASTDAVAAALAKSPELDEKAKATYQTGMARLGIGLVRYVQLRTPAQNFASGLKTASPLMLPKLAAGGYVVTTLPGSISSLGKALKNATSYAKSHDIPVPQDATQALSVI